jgi:error-prone DNA polymerase
VFEKFRRVLLSSAMLGVRGRIQREGEVVHLVAQELTDLSAELASVGNRETPFPLPHGRGDEAHHGGWGLFRAECRRAETSSIPTSTSTASR